MIWFIRIVVLGISILSLFIGYLIIKDKIEIARIDKILNKKEE